MAEAVFYRGIFSEIWITLASNETLGILDSDYIEDYFGVDGRVSLYHPASGQRWPILMQEVLDATPEMDHDVFQGWIGLDELPDGDFSIQGRVKDIYDNYTVMGSVDEPRGDERIIQLVLRIAHGTTFVAGCVRISFARLEGGVRLKIPFPQATTNLNWPEQTIRLGGMSCRSNGTLTDSSSDCKLTWTSERSLRLGFASANLPGRSSSGC